MDSYVVAESYAVDLAPRLRRYAHALLGRLPTAARGAGEAGVRVDQDADDLVHDALIGFWRAGFRKTSEAGDGAQDMALRIALFRRVTILAREHLARKASQLLESGGRRKEDAGEAEGEARHFAWAPEARALPRLDLDLRALLALVTLERLNYDQAGAVLDMPAERALARLAFARARLASAISGEACSHLAAIRCAGLSSANFSWASAAFANRPWVDRPWAGRRTSAPVTEGDLHRLVDELLDESRSAEVAAALESQPDLMRRASEWRRQGARLRRAFEPLLREPLPLSLNFAAPERSIDRRSRSFGPADRLLRRLAALFALPDPATQTARRPF